MKGNIFSSRKLMLQGVRNNEDSPLFNAEYFRFEMNLLHKMIQRKKILSG